jgi:RNA polymerase sigma-70 factor (ECF subfamily)
VSLDDVGDKVGPVRSADGRTVLQGISPDASPASSELGAAIQRAIEALPDKQRLALVLFSIEGLPQKEVAAVLDCSVELVKWNVFQARKKLREALGDYL